MSELFQAFETHRQAVHIAHIKSHGRMNWQKTFGYNQRGRVETQMGRWKTVIGPKLKARSFANQKTEACIGVRVLNQMTKLGRPTLCAFRKVNCIHT
jgi:hypothetical protein